MKFITLTQKTKNIQIGQDIYGVSADDYCGTSVCLDSLGNTLVIGSTGNDDNGNDAGHVRIFEYVGGVWTQIGQNINGEYFQTTVFQVKFSDGISINDFHLKMDSKCEIVDKKNFNKLIKNGIN